MPKHSSLSGRDQEQASEWIRSRKLAEGWFNELMAESEGLKTEESTQRFWETLFSRIKEHLGVEEIEKNLVMSEKKVEVRKLTGEPWEDALKLCDEIMEKIDELPDKAEEFGNSVSDTVKSMAENIESRKSVTDKQMSALKNMERGVDRWLV